MCALSFIACGGNASTGDTNTVSGFPRTVENCGQQVTIKEPPKRVLLIDRYAVPMLAAVGAMDRVIAKIGEYPSELYSPDTRAAGLETVLGKDPDVLIILTVSDLQAAKDAFLSVPGATDLKAVRNNHMMVMRFDYTDPPTPLSIDGLDKVAHTFAGQR